MMTIPPIIVFMLNCRRIIKAQINNITKNTRADLMLIDFVAKGLFEVLAILASKSLSNKSLIIQPALRIKKDPIKNSRIKLISCRDSVFLIKAIANKHGRKSKKVPVGLLNLISSK